MREREREGGREGGTDGASEREAGSLSAYTPKYMLPYSQTLRDLYGEFVGLEIRTLNPKP